MIINLKSENDLSSFYVVYEGSTNLENKGWYGISHLMEHLLCKNFDHLQDDLDKDGIEWNAYTSSNEIVFYLQGLDEKVNIYKHKLVDLLGQFNATKEDFENERKIVLEEYMDYFNNQTEAHQLNLQRKLFNDFDPIGLREDLVKMKYIDCLNFFEDQFLKPSKIINVSKNKAYKNKLIDFHENDITRKVEFSEYDVPLELNNKFNDKTSLIMLSPIIEEDNDYINFINYMLSFGLQSPLYNELREKNGLIYYVNCYQNRLNKQGIVNISTQTSNDKADKVIQLTKKVLSNPDKYLTKDRFNTIREYYLVKKKKDEILRYKNVNHLIQPDGWSVSEMIENISWKKIRDVYDNYYNFKNFYISKDKDEFK
jgi:predicted Zn-dependent peptidase